MNKLLSTEPMQKLRMLFLESERNETVAFLHKMGIVDLRRSKLELGEVQSAELPEISNALIHVSGALGLLKAQSAKKMTQITLASLIAKVNEATYIDQIYQLGDKRREIVDDSVNLNYGEKIASYFSGVEINFGRLQSARLSFRSLVTDSKSAQKIEEQLSKEEMNSSVIVNQIPKKKESVVFIAYQKDANLDEILKSFKIEEIDLKSKYLIGTPQEILALIKKTRGSYEAQNREIEKKLAEMGKDHYSDLENYREMLEIEAMRANAAGNFKKTDKVFVVEGWIAAKKYDELVSELKKFTKNRFEIEKLQDGELAPTLVNRPGFLKPFDFLMEFYSVPRSDEIDPTWIFIITFPIFYGLMISDVGYGIASFLLATLITKKTGPEDLLHNVARVWQLCALSAVFFGFLSNQYFGFQLNQHFTSFVGFDWIKNATSILLVTIIFGLVQVILGFIFSFINHYKHHHIKHAMSKLSSIVTILVGVVAVYGFFTGASYVGIFGILTAVFLVVTAAISGIEASEITNLMTHPLSYARILGFGMASIIIAMLIDNAFTPSLKGGVLGFIILSVIFVLLHFVNMVLGMFEGLIQGIRLNFVEFFSKFYTGGGVKFRPFSYKRVSTREEE